MSYKTDFTKIDLNVYEYDKEAAEAAVRYIEQNIRHVAGPLSGELIKLEKWQKDEIIKPLFGWKHVSTGFRKYTSAYIEIPKKNGKTLLSAAIAALFLDPITIKGEAPMYSVAGNRDQARLAFKATKGIIEQSKRLSEKAEIYQNSIRVGQRYFQAMSRESRTHQGVNPVLVIADEVHIHKDTDLIENMRKSMIARDQKLLFMITTAGFDLNGPGYQYHTHAKETAEGNRTDEHQLVCIYCADKEDDIFDEKTWKKANPNYGVSVKPEGLKDEIARAEHSEGSRNSFRRYHLNIWTDAKDSWIDKEVWDASGEDIKDLSFLEGQPCYGGMDLASNSDITAFSLIFPRPEGKYISLTWMWLPEDKGFRSADYQNENYPHWVSQGLIEETPGNVTDYD